MEKENRKRVGIMGGTFDPIHHAHIALAECAKAQLSLDEVWFMPAGHPGFRLSRLEMERSGETYTSETLTILHARYPDVHFYFIVGSDSLYQLERWHAPETILRLATLVAAEREYADRPRSFGAQVRYLEECYGADVAVLPFEEMDISSTEIRARAARGEDITALVPAAVATYIEAHQLYR